MQTFKTITFIGSLCLLSVLNGCALSTKDARDPLENWNRGVQTFNDKVDDYALKPVAKGYQFITPQFVDNAVTHFFSNIDDIGVTLNDLLQFKFKQSAQDGARFLVNTVAGVGGLMDVAQKIDLPKHDEDFDQTLGFWGVPTGPYVVLPFLGPNSARGIGGKIGDTAMSPLIYVGYGVIPTGLSSLNRSFITGGLAAVKAVDTRADLLSTEKIANEAAIDRYDFFKNSYLQRRNYLVNDGNVTEEQLDFDESDLDPDAKSTSPSQQ
ncbi:MAG: VacJ family lipoprotein [Methylococcaceae bacterium]|nr:VacJ family lipoprotein [Methylococcaceae bacterium]